ncbi:hypothetical protein D9M72_542480 [compost metagenome]
MKGCLHPLAAFGDGLVWQPDDLHANPPGRDHHLNVDRHAFYSLECNRTDTRNHDRLFQRDGPPCRRNPFGCSGKSCTEHVQKQEQ